MSVPDLYFIGLFAALGKPSTIIDPSAAVEKEILPLTLKQVEIPQNEMSKHN